MNHHVHYRLVFVHWVLFLLGILALSACHVDFERKVDSVSTVKSGNGTSHSAEVMPTPSGVRLELNKQINEESSATLMNNTDKPIYVAYLPLEKSNTAKFLAYSIERKSTGEDFKAYREGFHFTPSLHPIAPQAMIQFPLTIYPVEPGEYRIGVTYYDDTNIYKIVTEKAPNWSDSEQEQIDRARKAVWSDAFVVTAMDEIK